jgi:hypothetical protein
MIRRLGLAAASLTLAGATVLLGAGTALADPPNGGCPSGGGWFLVPLSSVDPETYGDRGNLHDQNGDGFVCAKSHEDGSWTVKDNTNQ